MSGRGAVSPPVTRTGRKVRGLRLALLLAALMLALLPLRVRGQSLPGEGTPPDNSAPTDTVTTPAPALSPIPSHDWRAPGFVAVVEGRLYDTQCRPLRSIGSNVPNLMFRRGIRENLEWMRWHQMRWLRVIVTGHGHATQHPDVANGGVERRLEALLREVEAFNAAHDPSESIYALVGLTDYYEPGVPGDRFGFDKPGWCLLRVLNAPWYRRGVPRYDFEQECGGGRLEGAPNYEVNFKPWVQRIVAVGAGSPALLGWQLGNELKARNSPLNGIFEAYDWYLDWMRDMVDTIRAIDRVHLVFAGAQYMAELTDFPYRPAGNAIRPDFQPRYDELFDAMLRACAAYCWNAWSLTNYDFRLYAVDDAMVLERAGVAAVVTEFGFTLGTREEELERYGGDRRAAIQLGVSRPWQDIDGIWHPSQWGVLDLIERAGLDGIAPWGTPNPDPGTEPWLDLDANRGVANAPEGAEMWDIWHRLAGQLEEANRRASVSSACLAYRSV